MRRLLYMTVVLALAAARPETYKETEDFEYQRSSTDEGTKSGFYGAQRGNMGGNYERAHNMDGLAQHQMSGAVRQVEGELGDAAKTRTGSVYTSANSQGIYGSGKYDLGNLQGRNFQENVNYGDSQSMSSQSSQSSNYRHLSSHDQQNSAYNSESSRYKGYHGSNANGYGQLHTGNLQGEDQVLDYGRQANSHSNGYYSQSGHESQSSYGSSNTNLHSGSSYEANPQSRLIVTTPVRIVGRPGSRVAIPVGVQTYDQTHSASTLDQNSINSDAEILGSNQHIAGYKPTAHAKGYESSYSYRKQWEKHDTKPLVLSVPTVTDNPYPKNSELYDDTQASLSSNNNYHSSGSDSHVAHTSGYNSNSRSSAAQSRYQSAAESQSNYQLAAESQLKNSHSQTNTNAYNNGAYISGSSADATNLLGDLNSKPKSYHSSYAYHKSWERQGDPYEIKPASGAYAGLDSQRLTSASHNQGYTSQQYGTKRHQSHQSYTIGGVDCDCDENGHIRVARSPGSDQQNVDWQQSQNLGLNRGDLQDLQQQSLNGWDNYQQRGGQQRQNLNGEFRSKSEKIEDLREQAQNQWDDSDDFGQLQQSSNLQNLEQQNQNNWESRSQINNRFKGRKKRRKKQRMKLKNVTLPTLEELQKISASNTRFNQLIYKSTQSKNPQVKQLDQRQQNMIMEIEPQINKKRPIPRQDYDIFSEILFHIRGVDHNESNIPINNGELAYHEVDTFDRRYLSAENSEEVNQQRWGIIDENEYKSNKFDDRTPEPPEVGSNGFKTRSLDATTEAYGDDSNLDKDIDNTDMANYLSKSNLRQMVFGTDENLGEIMNEYNSVHLSGQGSNNIKNKQPILLTTMSPTKKITTTPSISNLIAMAMDIGKNDVSSQIQSENTLKSIKSSIKDFLNEKHFQKGYLDNSENGIHTKYDSSLFGHNIREWLQKENENYEDYDFNQQDKSIFQSQMWKAIDAHSNEKIYDPHPYKDFEHLSAPQVPHIISDSFLMSLSRAVRMLKKCRKGNTSIPYRQKNQLMVIFKELLRNQTPKILKLQPPDRKFKQLQNQTKPHYDYNINEEININNKTANNFQTTRKPSNKTHTQLNNIRFKVEFQRNLTSEELFNL